MAKTYYLRPRVPKTYMIDVENSSDDDTPLVRNRRGQNNGRRVQQSIPESDLFPTIDEEQLTQIQLLLMDTDDEKVIITRHSITIRLRDYRQLNWALGDRNSAEDWLNDQLIDLYMAMLKAHTVANPTLPAIHAFSTHFGNVLTINGYSHVSRWARNIDIFALAYLFIPWHVDDHWVLVMVDFPKKIVYVFDSMIDADTDESKKIAKTIRTYLRQEYFNKKSVDMDESGWKTQRPKGHQHRNNSSDCGVFCCMTARAMCLGGSNIIRQQHMHFCRQLMALEVMEGHIIV